MQTRPDLDVTLTLGSELDKWSSLEGYMAIIWTSALETGGKGDHRRPRGVRISNAKWRGGTLIVLGAYSKL